MDAIKDREDDEDAPIVKRKDAYDASLDVPDPEDIEKNISASDIEKEPVPTSLSGDDEDEDDIIDTEYDVKLLKSQSTGKYALATKKGSQIVDIVEVPEEYLEMAKANPIKTLNKLKSAQEPEMMEMTDEELMDGLNEMIKDI